MLARLDVPQGTCIEMIYLSDFRESDTNNVWLHASIILYRIIDSPADRCSSLGTSLHDVDRKLILSAERRNADACRKALRDRLQSHGGG